MGGGGRRSPAAAAGAAARLRLRGGRAGGAGGVSPEAEDDDDDEEEDDEDDVAPIGGDTLRSCIQGEGQPPHELLLAAVACAASGRVHGVPVERLREDDAIDELDLRASGIGVTGATLLAFMLPAAMSVRSLEYAISPTP